jgi:hypothetical protein
VFCTEAVFVMPSAGTPLAFSRFNGDAREAHGGSRMSQMLTAPGLTLLFLGVVVGLGVSFVWILWEIEQISKSHRNSDRFG